MSATMGEDENVPRTVTVYVGDSPDMVSEINDRIDHRHSNRSEWFREAAALRLEIDKILGEHGYNFKSEAEKRHFIRSAVRRKVKDGAKD